MFTSLRIYNKSLLNIIPANHPLIGPNGPIYSAKEKAEFPADTFQNQFTVNPGPLSPEVSSSIHKIPSQPAVSKDYTSPAAIQKILKYLPKRKAPGEDLITNSALKNLPQKQSFT